ncbi:hypothetical protein BD779DRAFT_1726398 [Infundibulicybe gibba]|nr:hypothetical protein BD779DRAFT_1726398 [Infundibulicybe gibba]
MPASPRATSSTNTSPARQKSTIPRPPPSPLRPGSLSPSPATPTNTRFDTTSPPPSNPRDPSRRSVPSTPPPQKARARDLLRKHYGLGVGPPPPLPGKSADVDPMNLDSSAFDAKAYYEQLITTSSLPALELDSERQSLVYNHHHELIAASHTISAMKTRAESLDADLDLLKAAFSEISRLSAEVAVENHNSSPDATPRL